MLAMETEASSAKLISHSTADSSECLLFAMSTDLSLALVNFFLLP